MKGYRMVLLVNGGIFLFVALNAFLLGRVMQGEANRCAADDPANPSCPQTRDSALTAIAVSPFIALGGLVLLVLGTVLGRPRPSPQGLPSSDAITRQGMQTDWASALHEGPDGLVIDIEVVPNARSPGFPVGFNPWRKRVQARVSAPPEDGKANEELIGLVAAALGVPRDRVTLVDGHTSRRKRILVRGTTANGFLQRVSEDRGER